MASNKIIRFGPVAMTIGVSNILNAPTVTGGTGLAGTNTATYLIIRHLRIVNKSASPATATCYIGATTGSAAGTEFAFTAASVSANAAAGNYLDWYGMVRLEATDFLTGFASAATSLTIEGEGEIGLA
jgi:hypothetical protein